MGSGVAVDLLERSDVVEEKDPMYFRDSKGVRLCDVGGELATRAEDVGLARADDENARRQRGKLAGLASSSGRLGNLSYQVRDLIIACGRKVVERGGFTPPLTLPATSRRALPFRRYPSSNLIVKA